MGIPKFYGSGIGENKDECHNDLWRREDIIRA
jgi:hypothetical protein